MLHIFNSLDRRVKQYLTSAAAGCWEDAVIIDARAQPMDNSELRSIFSFKLQVPKHTKPVNIMLIPNAITDY